MKKLQLLLILLTVLFFSCDEIEEGEFFIPPESSPDYPSSILKKAWTSEIEFLHNFRKEEISEVLLVDNIWLIITRYYIYAHSAEDGELMWAFRRIPAFELENFSAKIIGDRLFILPREHCSSQFLVLNKNSGDLEDLYFLKDLPGVEGLCGAAFFHNKNIYFSSKIWNNEEDDPFDYSLYIYKYDLQTENTVLLYRDDLIYRHSRIIQPVINSEQTDIYFLYGTHDSENHHVQIVEIPLDESGQGEVVFSVQLARSSPVLRYNSFFVKEKTLLGNFEHVHNSLRAYDLEDDGNLLWIINSNFDLYSHKGEIYFIRLNQNRSLSYKDVRTRETLWFHRFYGQPSTFNFLNDRHLATSLSENEKYLTIIDLNTGGLLVGIDFESVGSDDETDSFYPTVLSYDNGEKILVVTLEGRLACLELPF